MKKLTTSIVVAAALAAPVSVMAETVMYGLMDASVVSLDNGTGSHLDVIDGNGTSRLGVKGSEDLGNGMKAIFQYEWQVQNTEGGSTSGFNNALSNRVALVGLSGGFGTVSIGRQSTPYSGAVDTTDIMNVGNQGTFLLIQAPSRAGNVVGYTSPDFGGISFGVAVSMDNDGAGDTVDDVESGHLGINYDNGPLHVGFGYIESAGIFNGTGATTELMGLGASYSTDMFGINASIEETDSDNAATADIETWAISGEMYFGNNTVKATYSDFEQGATEADAWQIGLEHSFSKRTRVYVEYADLDAATDQDQFGLGLRHDF